jgi:hypothetical protein
MAPPAIGIGTLRRLGHLETSGGPVLSVYSGLNQGGCPSAASREGELEAELHYGHTPDEWSQLGLRHPIEDRLAEHARRLGGLLLRAHRRRAFDNLVVAAPRELWPFIEGALDSVLRARLAGLVELDLEHETAQEIVRAVAITASTYSGAA